MVGADHELAGADFRRQVPQRFRGEDQGSRPGPRGIGASTSIVFTRRPPFRAPRAVSRDMGQRSSGSAPGRSRPTRDRCSLAPPRSGCRRPGSQSAISTQGSAPAVPSPGGRRSAETVSLGGHRVTPLKIRGAAILVLLGAWGTRYTLDPGRSWGGRRPSMVGCVTLTRPQEGAPVSGCRTCCRCSGGSGSWWTVAPSA